MSTLSAMLQSSAGSRNGPQHESAKARQQSEEERALVRTLDQARSSLSTLNLFMSSLTDALHKNDPLPPWEDVMASFKAIDRSLRMVRSNFAQSRTQLESVHVYPLPNFPPEREGVRTALMRKRLDPTAEDMIRAGENIAREYEKTHDTQEFKDMLDWATEFVLGELMTHPWNADFTEEELKAGWKTAKTGLTRTSRLNHDWDGRDDTDQDDSDDNDDEDDDDDDDEDMEDAGTADFRRDPALSLDDIMRMVTRGGAVAQGAQPTGAP